LEKLKAKEAVGTEMLDAYDKSIELSQKLLAENEDVINNTIARIKKEAEDNLDMNIGELTNIQHVKETLTRKPARDGLRRFRRE